MDPAPALPLSRRIGEVQARLALMTPETLAVLEARSKVVLEECKREQGDLSVVAGKISDLEELHKQMRQWDAVCQDLPRVVERLNSLKRVHDSGLLIGENLQTLEADSQAALLILKSSEELLRQVQDGFQQNMHTILQNCETLGNRLTAL